MTSALDLSFFPYLDASALWQGIPIQETTTTPVWQWSPALKLAHDSDLDTINELTMAGWQRLDGDRWGGEMNSARYMRMVSQLSDVRAMHIPGSSGDELWARTEDIERAEAIPVTLTFARTGIDLNDSFNGVLTISKHGLAILQVAQILPPPQFGEIALIDGTLNGQHVTHIYMLSALGEAGLALWRRMGAALKALAAPSEWWPYTAQLDLCIRGEYTQLREALRSKLLDTKGQEREEWRARLAHLDIDRKHAEALHKYLERARKEPAAWQEQWQEVQNMAADLAALYWAAHQQAVSVTATVVLDAEPDEAEVDIAAAVVEPSLPQDPEGVNILAQIVDANDAPNLDTPSYIEDRAAREAMLADKGKWPTEAGIYRYKTSNDLAVYYGDPMHPLELAEAQAQLQRIRESTVLTVRIAEGIWNLRRHDARYARNGTVGISYNEILQWRGVKKHSRAAYPGSPHRTTDGYRSEDRDDVRRDFEVARPLYLRGHHTVYDKKGKPATVNVEDQYIRVSFVSAPTLWGTDEQLGVFFAPGDWHSSYEEEDNIYLAEIDRRVFQLNPQNEQHELKIALFLAEEWRYRANKGKYAEPVTMASLLARSMIEVDKPNLTNRFAPRIERALETLQKRGIVGSCECLTPVDKSRRNWGKDWLAARWRILPPDALMQSYIEKLRKHPPQLSSGRSTNGTGAKPTQKGQ